MDEIKEHKVLTENTLIPISAVVFLAGAIVWVTTIYAQNLEHGKQIEELKKSQGQLMEDVGSMRADVSYVRGYLERKNRGAKGDM